MSADGGDTLLNLEIVGQGATTKIYRDGDKAIKLYENAQLSQVENEAWLQSFAAQAGLPVPIVYGVRELEGSMTALYMQYIPGQPIMQAGMTRDDRQDAIHTLVKLQCMVHAIHADGLPRQGDRLAHKVEQNQYINSTVKSDLLSKLKRLDANDKRLCHGDFHPLNVLHDGQKHWIIDWVDATAGDPIADACRSYLIFKQHLPRSSGIYLRLFCKEAGVAQKDVLAWLPILAAARMTENMDESARAFLHGIVNIA